MVVIPASMSVEHFRWFETFGKKIIKEINTLTLVEV